MSSTVVSYIPAIHQGYIKFLNEHPGDLYVLGKQYIHETPRMERDIRAVDPADIVKMIEALKIMSRVQVLDDIKDVGEIAGTIVLPDEDVNRTFAKKYLKGKKVAFESAFLRWDRQISTTELEVPANRTISRTDLDRELMAVADAEAAKSADWWRQIGAVISRDGKPLLVGHNRPLNAEDYTVNVFGDPRSNFDYGEYIELVKTIHAEAGVIAEAAKRGLKLKGAAIYVSTFPCPVCAKLIAAAGIKKVYYNKGYSLLDAEDVLGAAGVEIILVDTKK